MTRTSKQTIIHVGTGLDLWMAALIRMHPSNSLPMTTQQPVVYHELASISFILCTRFLTCSIYETLIYSCPTSESSCC